MARKTLTDKGVAALKAKSKLYSHPDPQMPGHYVRASPVGNKVFVAVARDPSGKQKWVTIGNAAHIGIDEARERARGIITRVKGGESVKGPQSFETVAKDWLKRHVEAQGLITAPAIRRYLNNHILPAWGGRDFASIGRSDITTLLDTVEDSAGPVAADKVLAYLSGLFNWYASRNDKYNSPIVRGMRRTKTTDRARERILSDDEIRKVWSATEGTFGDLVKLLLLTAQRRDKVASMRWEDVAVDGTWSVRNGIKREKGTGGDLALPSMAIDIIRSRPRFASNPHVFPAKGTSYLTAYSKHKATLDKVSRVSDWTLHDLRRTARSLMSRAGVRPDISERVLGHAINGVEGTYDRHSYLEEKAHALRALASLVESILDDQPDKKVRRLRG